MPVPSSIPLPLSPARVHEVCGAGAVAFAAVLCAPAKGPVLWIGESWRAATVNPAGLAVCADPRQFLFAETRSQTDTLSVAEEALKDGAVTLVIAEMTRPIDLREGRRLQLAARAGGATGLCLIPEGMGSNAAETRWRCDPVFDPEGRADSTLMRWELIKNKKGTIGAWHVRWDAAAHRLSVVSAAGFGPGTAAPSG